MLRILRFCIILVVLLSGFAFHLRNDQLVVMDYYIGTIDLPFSLFIVIALCFGAILGTLASLPGLIKLRRDKRKLQNQIKISEKEVNNLRVMPMKDMH